MRKLCGLALLAAVTLVSACGSDKTEQPMSEAVIARLKTIGKGKPATAPAGASYTRAQLQAAGVPILRVRIKARSLESLLPQRDRRGNIRTWATNDGTLVTLRDGMVISTRALLPDLMSASVPSVAQISRAGGTHARSYYFLGDSDSTQRLDFSCRVESLGPETIDLVQRLHRTVHMREHCTGAAGNLVNDYWIEGGSTVRKAREWINPKDGYIETEGLVD